MQLKKPGTKSLDKVCEESGVKRDVFLRYVQREWIRSSPSSEWEDEDIRRAHLIVELQNDFGVNDEAVPIILHLLDQLHAMHRVLRRLDLENVAEISLRSKKGIA
jgi:chaperone modulatory protein CbpM